MTEIKAEVAWQYALPKLLGRFQECVRMAESTRRDDLATSSCHLAYASGVKSEIVKLVSDLSSDPAGKKVRELERKVYVLEAELGGARADAIRAAGVEPVERDALSTFEDWRAAKAEAGAQMMRADTEKARADKAEALWGVASALLEEYRDRAIKAEATLAAEQVAHAKARRDHESAMGRADQARAEADALRAEVAALRGLANIHPSRGDVPAVKAALDAMRGKWGSSEGAVAAIAAALATVPPAKVADAAKPEPECTCAASGHFNLAEINACLRHGARAPKPEPAGLEPLGPPTVPGFPPMHYRGLVARINELSAIAKRGGS